MLKQIPNIKEGQTFTLTSEELITLLAAYNCLEAIIEKQVDDGALTFSYKDENDNELTEDQVRELYGN